MSNGIHLDIIIRALKSFKHSVEQTPGRLNLFEYNGAKIFLDYAHNPHGLQAFGKFICKLESRKRIGIVTGVGDRRDEDIIAMGEESARIFHEIIIRVDDDLRGRNAEEINKLLVQGIKKVDDTIPVHFFEHTEEAVAFAFNKIENNDLLALFVDDINKSIDMIIERIQTPVRSLIAV